MKKYIYLTIGIVSMLIVTSCQKDVLENPSLGEGGFSLALNVDDSETVATRAAMTPAEAVANADVKIYKPNTQGLIRQYTYSEMPNVVYLPKGNGYRIDVVAGEATSASPRKANFEQKSYKGSTEFDVVANNITNSVNLTAKICNAITNATFDPTIAENFEDGYTLTFSLTKDETNPDKTLVYTSNKSGMDGYFIIDNLLLETNIYWAFNGNLKSDGSAFTADGFISASTDSDDADNVNDLAGARQKMTFKYVVKDGKLTFELDVDMSTEDVDNILAWSPTSTGISTSKPYEIWATFATVHADVDTDTYDADEVYFQYRKKTASNSEEWVRIKATKPANEGDQYSAEIKGLTANTEYEYQLILCTKDTETINDAGETVTVEGEEIVIGDGDGDGNADEPTTLTTGNNQQVPNASFEDAHTGSSGMDDGVTLFYPQGGTPWWGSGNQKVSIATAHVTKQSTTVPHSKNNNKYSVILKSEVVSGVKFAAGNIYSGYFYDLDIATQNGIVHFGRTTAADGKEFTSRPTGVSFYVRYQGNKVDNDKNGPLTSSNYDKGQIKFAIGTWGKSKYGGSNESPVAVNTANTSTFWDIASLDETTAYCDKIFEGNGSDTGWLKVTLKFDYNSNGKGKNPTNPTHIIISAASSMYGDYFEGASGSTMYLDDIQLLYDHPDDIQEGTVAVQ